MPGGGYGGVKWGGGPWGGAHHAPALTPPPGPDDGGGATEPPRVFPLTLEEILAAYVVFPPVQEVDAMVATYRQRGADRALTALLECRFQDFFGFDHDEASFAGALMKGLRALAREDLSTSKYGRAPAGTQTLVSSAPERDPEYTITGDDQPETVSPPED